MKRAGLFVGLFVLLSLAANTGHAQPGAGAPLRPDFVGGSAEREAFQVALPGALLTLGSFFIPQDQTVRANTSRVFDKGQARRSDFTGAFVGVGLSLGLGTALEAAYLKGYEYEWLYTPMLAAEGAVYGFAVSSTLKRLVGRCRPAVYDEERGCVTDRAPAGSNFRGDEALRAWPSAHVMPLAGTAGAFLGTFVKGVLFGRVANERLLASLVALSLSFATMHYRVSAGAHSLGDVWSAFGIGNGLGMALAWLHPMVRAGANPGSSGFVYRVVPTGDGLALVGGF